MLIFKTRFQVKMNVGLTFTATPTFNAQNKTEYKNIYKKIWYDYRKIHPRVQISWIKPTNLKQTNKSVH